MLKVWIAVSLLIVVFSSLTLKPISFLLDPSGIECRKCLVFYGYPSFVNLKEIFCRGLGGLSY